MRKGYLQAIGIILMFVSIISWVFFIDGLFDFFLGIKTFELSLFVYVIIALASTILLFYKPIRRVLE